MGQKINRERGRGASAANPGNGVTAVHAYVLMTNHVHLSVTPHAAYLALAADAITRRANHRALFDQKLDDETLQHVRSVIQGDWALNSTRFAQDVQSQLARRAMSKKLRRA